MQERIPVILDCDNTMGVPGCDVDDGIALLYLLGSPQVNLLGVTCAYGNNTQKTVYSNTLRLMELLGRPEIPVLRGTESEELTESVDSNDLEAFSQAAHFLAEAAKAYSGELVVIATGSMSNLKEAQLLNDGFFKDLCILSMMGGLTEPLLVGGEPMRELNLSCDPVASLECCSLPDDVRIATAQNSLYSFIEEVEFQQFLAGAGELGKLLKKETDYWFAIYREHYHLNGFVCWDVMAAVQAVCPEWVRHVRLTITPSEESLEEGNLMGGGDPIDVDLPVIDGRSAYISHVFDVIQQANVKIKES